VSLFGLFEKRGIENPALPLTSDALLQLLGPGFSNDAGVIVTPESSLTMAAVFRGVSLISGLGGALPLGIYDEDSNEPASSPLLTNPHPDMPVGELLGLSYIHRCLWGNAFFQKVRDPLRRVQWIYPMSPWRMKVGRVRASKITPMNPSGKVFSFTDDDGKQHTLTPYEVLHIPHMSYDGLNGVSPVRMAAQAVAASLAAEKSAAKLFSSGNLLSGLLQTEQRLTQEQAETLQERWASKFAGADRAHEVAVLDSGAQFQSMTMPSSDAQMLESRDFEVTELARFFGVPPYLMFQTEKSTSWGCLPGDTWVYTTSGPRPIANILPGDEVWSWSDDTGMVAAKVTDWQMTGHQHLLTINTSTRQLRVTEEHRVPIRRYFGRDAGRPNGQTGWETIEVAAKEIQEGDCLLTPLGAIQGTRTTEPATGRELTVRFMELLGYYSGNGSLDRSSRVEFSHEAHAPLLPHYRETILKELGVEAQTDRMRGTRTRFSSFEFQTVLNNGFCGKAHTKRVASWVFECTPELQIGWLRGYLDSDGHISQGVITYTSVSRGLLEDVRQLCMCVGVPVGRVHKVREGGPDHFQGRPVIRRTTYALHLSSSSDNPRIGSNHPAKASRLQPDKKRKEAAADPARRGLKPADTWEHEDVALQKVTSRTISPLLVPVYDITVEEHAHFVADGVVVHNTALEQQATGFVKFDLHPRWLSATEQRITKELLPAGKRAKYKIEGLLRGDTMARAEFYRTMREMGILTANEIRELEDRTPIEGGDMALQPANMVPLGTTPEDIAQAQAKAKPSTDAGSGSGPGKMS